MTYSVDLRARVISFVLEGGSKSEAVRRFKASRSAVYEWLGADSLVPKKHGRRRRKLDWDALKADIAKHPDALLRERAAAFGVRMSSIQYACGEMGITHKKNLPLRRTQR